MDYSLSNLYALQQSDDHESIFEIPSYDISCQEQKSNLQELAAWNDLATTTTTTTVRKKSIDPLSVKVGNQGKESESSRGKNKKVTMHRDIERQRRQEMSKLYASLRSLLPLGFIKGTRSISDHMHQAVSYIKFMQEAIQELNMKRDKLKKLSNESIPAVFYENNLSESSIINSVPNTVIISSCQGGLVEILVNGSTDVERNPLSRILGALLEEEHSVISCSSTKVNDRLLQTIRFQVSNKTSISGLSMLQEKLAAVVNT